MANFRFQNIFTVPFVTGEWDDSAALHQDLLRRISAHQNSYRGDSRSNIGGWRSENRATGISR